MIDGILKRAVRPGVKRQCFEQGRELPKHLGIDETSFQKRHEYVTVACDREKKNPENLTADLLLEIETLRRVAEKTGRAWALKKTAMDAWRYRSRHWARGALLSWYNWAIRSRLEPMREIARMVKRHLEGLVNAIYYDVTAIHFHLGGLNMAPETETETETPAPIPFHTT